MYTFKDSEMKVPCNVWAEKDSLEHEAINQIRNASSLPFAFHHTVLCPDAHVGYGAPIGGILATKDVIIPNFVGVDIGCGLCAVKTSLKGIETDTLKQIMGEIRKVIPVGFNKHKEEQNPDLMPRPTNTAAYTINNRNQPSIYSAYVGYSEYNNARKSLGTLGGGNHFIEIQKDEEGFIWIMIHSGSRNLGLKVATHYNNLAIELNKKWFSEVDPKWELAFLPADSEEGKAYIREMNYCVEFALANRKLMMDRVMHVFNEVIEAKEDFIFEPMINIAHNYAKLENHYGENVFVHRKGATSSQEGEIGIIPGSQGTKSYIVRGRGNPLSFKSCSHGAGRTMSRKKAKETLNLEDEIKRLDDMGVIHGMRHKNDLDEAASSYKDIDMVMENQKDLVEIIHTLTPLGVIKG